MNSPQIDWLHRLSRLYGLQATYYDINRCRREASPEALLAVLQAMGAPLVTFGDVVPACRERRQSLWQRLLQPVIVAWDGELAEIEVRLPASVSETVLAGHLTLETGERQTWEWRSADLRAARMVEVEGGRYVAQKLPVRLKLPLGYHRFTLEAVGMPAEAFIISAPLQAYAPVESSEKRTWGVFLPLYALRTRRSWGAGDFSDLATLIKWVAGKGGQAVATLPLLATFLEEIFEPSPYLPVSRLFWNEFYLDITGIPELNQCPSAQALLASCQGEIENLRSLPLVDYRQQMALKRRILAELSQYFFAHTSNRFAEFQLFVEKHPAVESYARFRAAVERQHTSWWSWPERLQNGLLREGDYDEAIKCYYLYAQWLVLKQMANVAKTAHEQKVRLYLDLPLGVHPDGYDMWYEKAIFATNASVGAPPDNFFIRGQNWGFPPFHPERIREQGYQYVINYLRHHCQSAGILRIDHVMGLHRLFWIVNGMEASTGVYVHYPAEEFYAILSLESHRNDVILVGEDLGTVPGVVRPAMTRHGLSRMYVLSFELTGDPRAAVRPVFSNAVASLNTHDTPPFAAFWQGLDIKKRLELGFLDAAGAQKEQQAHQALREALGTFLREKGLINQTDIEAMVRGCLAFLSMSQAWSVLVNLEDLWLEVESQNMPGTRDEHPNWRRKARYSFEEFCLLPLVLETLREINSLRKISVY